MKFWRFLFFWRQIIFFFQFFFISLAVRSVMMVEVMAAVRVDRQAPPYEFDLQNLIN